MLYHVYTCHIINAFLSKGCAAGYSTHLSRTLGSKVCSCKANGWIVTNHQTKYSSGRYSSHDVDQPWNYNTYQYDKCMCPCIAYKYNHSPCLENGRGVRMLCPHCQVTDTALWYSDHNISFICRSLLMSAAVGEAGCSEELSADFWFRLWDSLLQDAFSYTFSEDWPLRPSGKHTLNRVSTCWGMTDTPEVHRVYAGKLWF